MAEVKIELGLDASQLKTGLAKATTDVSNFSQKASRSFQQVGRQKGIQGGTGIGGVGMQLQDVAVQLQMGTRLSTVFAQQGSQIASSFGTAGIAIGAAIAVFATLYTVGQKNKENFDALVKSSKDLTDSFESLNASSSFEDIAGGAKSAKDQIALLNQESDRLGSKSGVLADYLGELFGGKTSEVKNEETDKATGKLMMDRVALGKIAVESSKEELRIAELRAQGLTDQADEAQRVLDLTRELASIDKLPFTTAAKDDLKKIATDLSETLDKADKLKKEKKDTRTGADTNDDGFISKREKRVYDLAQERGQRKADSIKGFSRKERGLPAFAGLDELREMEMMREMHGFASVGLRFAGVKSTDPVGTTSARYVQGDKGGWDRVVASQDRLYGLLDQRFKID